jgi:quercetin dioxygenase-like cupin family protein
LPRAYRLFTGPDGHSHVERGQVELERPVDVDTIEFRETAAGASRDWHNAPVAQYVITLAGVLEFETKTGERFTIRPGDVLLALDVTGTGHAWRLVDDEPWSRAYLTIRGGVDRGFVAES